MAYVEERWNLWGKDASDTKWPFSSPSLIATGTQGHTGPEQAESSISEPGHRTTVSSLPCQYSM